MTPEKEKLINSLGRAEAWTLDAAEQIRKAGIQYRRTRWEMIARLSEIRSSLAAMKKEIQE